jgi:DNA invertase Pin-like site-specific DNA recombinase
MIKERAVAYIRVSTEEQARGGISLHAQDDRIRAYCLAANLELVDVVREEGVSGAKRLDSRPGGKQLLALVGWQKVQHVVGLKLDRLFRDAEDALRQTRAWDRAGVALHLVDMGGQSVNTASAMGRMVLTMMAAFAELERNLIAERTATALGHKKKHGRVYGPIPYGYTRNSDLLKPCPAEQDVIRRMQLCRWNGWTFRRVADLLNQEGVPCKAAGHRWYASTVRQILANDLHSVAPIPPAA